MKIAKILLEPARGFTLLGFAASNQATLILLVVLGFAIVTYYQMAVPGRIWVIAIPTLLLILNFLLALATRRGSNACDLVEVAEWRFSADRVDGEITKNFNVLRRFEAMQTQTGAVICN